MDIADKNPHVDNAQPVLSTEAAYSAQHPLPTADSATDKQEGTAIAPKGRQSTYVAAGSKIIPAESSEKEDDEMKDDIPWYVDPETYKRLKIGAASVPGGNIDSSEFASQAASIDKSASVLRPSVLASQRLEPQPQQPPRLREGPLASAHPASFARQQQAKVGPAWALPTRHDQWHDVGPGLYQAADATPSLPLPLLHDLDRISTSPRAAPLHSPIQPEQHADVLAEAKTAPLPLPGRQVAHGFSQYGQDLALQQQALARQEDRSRLLQAVAAPEAAETEAWQAPLRSYSDAWTQMMEVCLVYSKNHS